MSTAWVFSSVPWEPKHGVSIPSSSTTSTSSATSTTDSLLERLTQMECQGLRLQSQITSLVTPETLEVMAKLDAVMKQDAIAKKESAKDPEVNQSSDEAKDGQE